MGTAERKRLGKKLYYSGKKTRRIVEESLFVRLPAAKIYARRMNTRTQDRRNGSKMVG